MLAAARQYSILELPMIFWMEKVAGSWLGSCEGFVVPFLVFGWGLIVEGGGIIWVE